MRIGSIVPIQEAFHVNHITGLQCFNSFVDISVFVAQIGFYCKGKCFTIDRCIEIQIISLRTGTIPVIQERSFFFICVFGKLNCESLEGNKLVHMIDHFVFSKKFGHIFCFSNEAFAIFLSLMMIPNELVIITNFVTITDWQLRNTFWGLILPSVTSVFYIYLLKENFEQIPEELYKAAKVDGTSDLKYLLKVMIPICKPTVITITILKVIECWNSYVWPRLITDDANYFLVSNGIQTIRESGFGRENIPAMMAAVVAVSVPLIVLFLIFHKKIMDGVSRGGTKG